MGDVEEPSPEIFGRDADLDARVEERTAALRRVNQALRERDIERLADQVELHLDTEKLKALCGLG